MKIVPAKMNSKTGKKIYKCKTCEKCFNFPWNLDYHNRHVHLGLKDAKCKICEKLFSTKYQLREHERLHSESKPFECETCGLCFKQKSTFSSENLIVC